MAACGACGARWPAEPGADPDDHQCALVCEQGVCDWKRELDGTESDWLLFALRQVHSTRPGHSPLTTPSDRSAPVTAASSNPAR